MGLFNKSYRSVSGAPFDGGLALLFVLAMIMSLVVGGYTVDRIYNKIQFGRHCGGFLKQASDASTVELAVSRLDKAIAYMDEHNLVKGYTSVFYTEPDEDVGFWYLNIKTAREDLLAVNEDSEKLALITLREELLDNSKGGMEVTLPSGIAIFPNNVAYCWWAWLSMTGACILWIGYCIRKDS